MFLMRNKNIAIKPYFVTLLEQSRGEVSNEGSQHVFY